MKFKKQLALTKTLCLVIVSVLLMLSIGSIFLLSKPTKVDDKKTKTNNTTTVTKSDTIGKITKQTTKEKTKNKKVKTQNINKPKVTTTTTTKKVTSTNKQINTAKPKTKNVQTANKISHKPKVRKQSQTTTQTKPITTTKQNYNYQSGFQGTWYTGGVDTYGYSGRTLISGYSVASNYYPQGTIIQVKGAGLDGTYRVDDKGAMSNNVIDFYYQRGCVPSYFRKMGRVNIEVCKVE